MNVDSAKDVLMHKNMLQLAKDPANRLVFAVRLVQPGLSNVEAVEEVKSSSKHLKQSVPSPAFGSAPDIKSLTLEAHNGNNTASIAQVGPRPVHEITFSTVDRPKLLSLLTSLLAELGLNVQEAHAFSTNDGYSLDVFLVDGWQDDETEQLHASLQHEIQNMRSNAWSNVHPLSPSSECSDSIESSLAEHVRIPNDGTNTWEIDIELLNFGHKIASGSYGNLYKGTYCNQDVAIKVLKPERVTDDMQPEFAQEITIMQKVRHKNVVQFVGACTKPNSFFIITEFMSRGSVYDYMRKQKGPFKLPALLRVSIDVAKGMDYLHQNNIIHRDLKAANLLMDENEVVKVGDFGVARVKAESGIMTAETGTFRWMAPEVIEHKPYDHKADVFSFGIVLWELITAKVPYHLLTPIQAAIGVVQSNLRPTIPKNTHPKLAALMQRCWQQDPTERPEFTQILQSLQQMAKEVEGESEDRRTEKSKGFMSVLLRGR